jgi:hypothetical protein
MKQATSTTGYVAGEVKHEMEQALATRYREDHEQPEPEVEESQWTAKDYDGELDGYPVLSPGGLAAIATDPEYQELIVTAVNNHAALVAALEQFVSIYPPNARRHPDVAVAISNAETVLARVRQK